MKIQYCSDLHLEFPENNRHVNKNPILPVGEILLLAGDILPFALNHLEYSFFDYVADHFEAVYWVPGNHEYYGTDLSTMPSNFEESIRPNILLLNNITKEIPDPEGSIELIFSTLWSHIPPHLTEIVTTRVQDFSQILWKGNQMTPQVYNQLHQQALEFLGTALGSNCTRKMVISHHCPSFLNYPKKHQKDPINAFFASNLDDFIQKTAPNAWIFGHHHSNIPPFLIGKTMLYTNQLGYTKFREGAGFDRSATITV
jgi:Icc-related predicted phosphoesterase